MKIDSYRGLAKDNEDRTSVGVSAVAVSCSYTGAVLAVRTTAGRWRNPPGGEQWARFRRVSSGTVGWRRSVDVGGGAAGRDAADAAEQRPAAAEPAAPYTWGTTAAAAAGLGAGDDAPTTDQHHATFGTLFAALASGRLRFSRSCAQPGRPSGPARQKQEPGR